MASASPDAWSASRSSFHLPLTGAFQASNALVALGLAMATGAPQDAALAALDSLKGARGRLELVGEHNGAAIFVDYAHKPVALETALDVAAALCQAASCTWCSAPAATATRASAR